MVFRLGQFCHTALEAVKVQVMTRRMSQQLPVAAANQRCDKFPEKRFGLFILVTLIL
jgi:hypothetical protein